MCRVTWKTLRMKMAGKTLNNSGMSLVEVIISMTILSVVVVAVLHSLTTSMIYNAKARRRQDTTFKAEAVMEVFKGYNVGELYEIFKAESTGDATTKAEAREKLEGMFGEAEFAVSGADPKVNPGEELTFDINDIEIKSTDGGVGEKVNIRVVATPTGTKELYKIEKINSATDVVFLSKEAYDTGARQKAFEAFQGSDDTNYANFLNELQSNNTEDDKVLVCDADGNDLDVEKMKATLTANHIALKERVTTFTITDAGVEVEMVYKFGIEGYPYYRKVYPEEATDTYDPPGTEPAPPSLAVAGELKYANYSGTGLEYEVSVDNGSISNTSVDKLYIYYYPQYATWNEINADGNVVDSPSIKDTIVIDNQRSGTPAPTIRCYLIKQKCATMSEATVKVRDERYSATVEHQGGAIELYHNLKDNVGVKPDQSGMTATPTITGFANNGGKGEAYLDFTHSKVERVLAYTIRLTVSDKDTGAEVATITSSANER